MKKYCSTIYTSGAYYTHDLPQMFCGLRRTPHDHTHTRPNAHLRLSATHKKIHDTQFFFTIKPNPKKEPIQNKNRFRWIRYSKMDIPNSNHRILVVTMSTPFTKYSPMKFNKTPKQTTQPDLKSIENNATLQKSQKISELRLPNH